MRDPAIIGEPGAAPETDPASPGAPSRSGGEASPIDEAGGDADAPREIGGREGPDPTRYGDWEKNGRCIDF